MKTLASSSIAVSLLVIGVLATTNAQINVAPECLGCICEASSACNTTAGCSGPGFCGLFRISWPFWADAGKPIIRNDNPDTRAGFENCSNDLYCAAETVRLYFNRFSTDCNGDGVINCNDYALLHKLGGYGCNGIVHDREYWDAFTTCLQITGAN